MWEDSRTWWRRRMWETLEQIRIKGLACPDHPNGKCHITYDPPSHSYMIHCMERPRFDLHPNWDKDLVRCWEHEHFDPDDWKRRK